MKECQSCQGLVPEPLNECPHCDNSRSRSSFSVGKAGKAVLMPLALVGMSITLQACYGVSATKGALASSCVDPVDKDGDGFFQCSYTGPDQTRPWFNAYYPAPDTMGAGDCDDANADIRPGADDAAGDGIDQNCDRYDGLKGLPDAALIRKPYACPDGQAIDFDSDGISSCKGAVPDWAFATMTVQGDPADCDDSNPAIGRPTDGICPNESQD